MSPVWCEPPPLSLLHSVPSSCPSPSTVDWHGTQWHPGHEGRPAAERHTQGHKKRETAGDALVSMTVDSFLKADFDIFGLRLLHPTDPIHGHLSHVKTDISSAVGSSDKEAELGSAFAAAQSPVKPLHWPIKFMQAHSPGRLL